MKKLLVLLMLSSFSLIFAQTNLDKSKNLKVNNSLIFYQPFKFKSFGYNNISNVIIPSFQLGVGYN